MLSPYKEGFESKHKCQILQTKARQKNTKGKSTSVMIYASELCKKHIFLLNSTVLALTVHAILAVTTIYTNMRLGLQQKTICWIVTCIHGEN